MIQNDKDLVIHYLRSNISCEKLLADFSVDIRTDKQYVISELEKAMETNDPDYLDLAITLLNISGISLEFVDILNKLLIYPNHYRHQEIARDIQLLKSPTSVEYIDKVLETNFSFLEYTASDSDAIAKWFSWALYSIGTEEAIDVMKKYTNVMDEGIKNEMQYRLKKMNVGNT